MNKAAMMRVLRSHKGERGGAYMFLINELEAMRMCSLVVAESITDASLLGMSKGDNDAIAFLMKSTTHVATSALWRHEMLKHAALHQTLPALISVMNLCSLMYARIYSIARNTGEEGRYIQLIKEVYAQCEQHLATKLGPPVFGVLWEMVQE
jgi:hypothetical protein